MSTTNNNFTVESLVAKYRNYVNEHCPKTVDLCEGKDGKLVEVLTPMPPYSNVGEQLLIFLYRAATGNNADKRIVDALSEYEQVFYKEVLAEDEFAYLREHYIEVVSFLFVHRDEWNVMGRELRHSISKERIRLVHEYLKPRQGSKVFIADTEYCDLAVQFPNCVVEGFTGWNYKHREVWALGQIRMWALGIKSEIVPGEEVDDEYKYNLPEKESVDYVIFRANENKYFAQNVFGTECNDFEALYDLLKPGGKMLFFSELKNEMAGEGKSDKKIAFTNFRERLVKEQSIESIVSYEDTAILGNGKMSYILLVISKSYNTTVCIKDEKKLNSKTINSSLLDSEVLWPSYYMANKPSEGIPLSSIVELAEEKHVAKFVKGEGYVLPDKAKGMILMLQNSYGESYKDANLMYKTGYYVDDPAFTEGEWINFFKAEEPCVLLGGNDEKLIMGYTTLVPAEGFAHDARCQLIPKKGYDVRYIAALLFNPTVAKQILTICDGVISNGTLSVVLHKIIVPNHNELERAYFLSEANYNALLSSQEEMKKEHEQYRKSVRMRKHALTQSLSSVKSMFNALNNYRNLHDGMISDSEKISRVKGTTVKEAFEFIDKNIKDMMPALEHIADVEYSFNKPEWIDPERFIEGYITKKGNGWLNFKPSVTWDKGNNQAKADLKDPSTGQLILKKGDAVDMLLFPKDALERVFNNIVSNAQAHGFADSTRKDYELRFSWHTDGIALIVEIENNGTAIPSERDTASLLEYGVSSALHQNGHNGIGCNEIDDIMRRYDGKVEIVSSPEKKFTVKYVLTFNRSNIVKFI